MNIKVHSNFELAQLTKDSLYKEFCSMQDKAVNLQDLTYLLEYKYCQYTRPVIRHYLIELIFDGLIKGDIVGNMYYPEPE